MQVNGYEVRFTFNSAADEYNPQEICEEESSHNNLHKRCSQREIKLNQKNAVLKQTQVTFMSHLITNRGIQADQRKVDAVNNMPALVDVRGVKRLCGTIQYTYRDSYQTVPVIWNLSEL